MKVILIVAVLAIGVLTFIAITQKKELKNADTYIGFPLIADYKKTPKV